MNLPNASSKQITITLASSPSTTKVDASNYIGVASDGTTPLGNGESGIAFINNSNNLISPTAVMFNDESGVYIQGSSSGNTVSHIGSTGGFYGNGRLALDLNFDGHTSNDAGDVDSGPNEFLNYPEVISAGGNPVFLQGTTCSFCQVYIYYAIGDPAGNGGGFKNSIGFTTADSSGNWSLYLPSGVSAAQITVQTYDPVIGSVSELRPRPQTYMPIILR